jgi:hypothetical protein
MMRQRAAWSAVFLAILLTACSGSSSGPSATPTSRPSRTHAGNCPTARPEHPGPDAAALARRAAVAAIPTLYTAKERANYKIIKVTPAKAKPADQVEAIPFGLCGELVGSRTFVVIIRFPAGAPSNSLSSGQLFLAPFAGGWKVWLRYH